MRFFRTIFFLFLVLFAFGQLEAQNLKENEIVVIKGEKFVLHQVRTGETIFSISRDFKIDRSDLKKYNPDISDGLDIGEILKIPLKGQANLPQQVLKQKGDPSRFLIHTIKSKKETPYFIAKKYGVTVEEIYAFNPKVKKFRKRKKIRIPVWEEEEDPVVEELQNDARFKNIGDNMQVHVVLAGETLYSISKKYGISESEVLALNPESKNLKAGSKIIVPKVVEEEIKEVEEESLDYFKHTIESGETMWGTTRKYKVSEEELKELNPALRTGFQAGVVIRIPVKIKVEETQAKPVNEDAFTKHLVKRGETLYGLSAKYDLKIHEIRKYNPVLETRNLVEGETVLIPQRITSETPLFKVDSRVDSAQQVEAFYEVELPIEIPGSCKTDELSVFSNSTYNVALFLPLFLEVNDTLNRESLDRELLDLLAMTQTEAQILQDTLVELEERKELFKRFYGNSESFVQFYEGVLLAVDSMQKSGMQINLNVFDTQRKADSIRQFIYSEDFLETDLIIGPVYEIVQKEVAQIAAKNRIPIVSPLAAQSQIVKSNPQFYQLAPTREYIADRTAEMIGEEYFNSNFIVVKPSDYSGTTEGDLVKLVQEKFFNSGFLSDRQGVSFTIYDLKTEGQFGLRRIMSKHKENVVIIPSTDEGELSVAISNVNNLTEDFSITLVGSNRFQSFHSINIEQYHNLKLRYITPYWMDYKNPATIQFVEKFKKNFGTEPGNFGTRGFDAAFYFLHALKYFGKDFEACLPYLHIDLIQGNYHFEKVSQFGGYMNQGVSVVSYSRDYEVERKRVKGQPKLVAGN
jgi:LysM repeat protein/ABC-type branched-subunit amino acid transport system substrate-binding protein